MHEPHQALQSLGIFDAANMVIDDVPESPAHSPQADVVVTVAEKKRSPRRRPRLDLKREGSMDAKVSVKNLFGFAERLDVNMEVGQQKSSLFKLSAARPRWMGRTRSCTPTCRGRRLYIKHSSFVEASAGASAASWARRTATSARTSLAASSSSDVCKLEKKVASWSILQQRGQTLKSSLT